MPSKFSTKSCPLIRLFRFLKVSDDLAKSTKNISIKAEAGKKVWNFSQLVKGVSALQKKGINGGKTPKAGM